MLSRRWTLTNTAYQLPRDYQLAYSQGLIASFFAAIDSSSSR